MDSNTDEVLYVFTDASFNSESKEGGIGGVLLNQTGTVTSWFGSKVSASFCRLFMDEDQEQAIGELEAFAVLVALHLWRQKLAKKHVVVFFDNEGCRFLILKVFAIAKILEWCIFPWYARVPTECNLADFPSREET